MSRMRTNVCVRIKSSYTSVEIIVSQSNVGWKINQSVVAQVLRIWIYLIISHMSSLNDHVLHLFISLRNKKILKNVIWLLLNDSHDRFTVRLKSLPFTSFAKIIWFMIMFFNFRLRLYKFVIFDFLLFSFFAFLVTGDLLVFL